MEVYGDLIALVDILKWPFKELQLIKSIFHETFKSQKKHHYAISLINVL